MYAIDTVWMIIKPMKRVRLTGPGSKGRSRRITEPDLLYSAPAATENDAWANAIREMAGTVGWETKEKLQAMGWECRQVEVCGCEMSDPEDGFQP